MTGGHPGRWGKRRKTTRKVFVRAFLAEILGLHPRHVGRLFSPLYHPADICKYLISKGFQLKERKK